MDASNYQNILRLTRNEADKQKIELIRNLVNPGMNEQVPDPYWNDNGFEQVFEMLDEACDCCIENYHH
jgi:protein-tyrosine phosphatase